MNEVKDQPLAQVIDGGAIRFERHLAAPLDRVWSAITEPAWLQKWLAEASFHPQIGGAITLRFGPEAVVRGQITAFDPPRILEYTWREQRSPDVETVVRFELSDADGGTRLLLTHMRLSRRGLVGFVAGWHAHLDMLEASLADRTVSWDERWVVLKPRYEELIGTRY